jgi:hypothetical protein
LPFLGFYHQRYYGGQSGLIRIVYRTHLESSQYTAYCLYQKYHIAPLYAKAGGAVAPEIRLEIGLMASIFIPTSILIFGFTSKADIHWIVPVIGAALYYLEFSSPSRAF